MSLIEKIIRPSVKAAMLAGVAAGALTLVSVDYAIAQGKRAKVAVRSQRAAAAVAKGVAEAKETTVAATKAVAAVAAIRAVAVALVKAAQQRTKKMQAHQPAIAGVPKTRVDGQKMLAVAARQIRTVPIGRVRQVVPLDGALLRMPAVVAICLVTSMSFCVTIRVFRS